MKLRSICATIVLNAEDSEFTFDALARALKTGQFKVCDTVGNAPYVVILGDC